MWLKMFCHKSERVRPLQRTPSSALRAVAKEQTHRSSSSHPMMSALARWIAELKRRHVLRVVSVYAVCAWLIIQIAATTFPYLRFPDWAVTAVIVLGVVGLPIVFVVSWMFDLTPT